MRFLSTLIASALGTLVALGVLALIFLMFVFAFVAAADQTPGVRAGSILVVELSGDIPEVVSGDPLAQAFSDEPAYGLRDLTFALEKAAVDERIDAVWLQVRGAGAPWATLQEVRDAVLAFRESGKPVIASSEDYTMGEREYFVASAADSVFASAEAIFEFNGFVMTAEFYKRLLDKLDVQPKIVRAGKYKSAVEPFLREDLSPENEEQLTELLQAYDATFMQAVSESRGLSREELDRLASEVGILTSVGAFDAGLLDGLLYEDEVQDVFRTRLGYDEDADLETVSLARYARVPASDAGLELADDAEIAVVHASGPIVSSSPDFTTTPMLGAKRFNEAMRQAREDEYIDAVVLRIDSPGGSAAASDAMWREIHLTSQVKPVVVSMSDVAASGGYWIATAGDTIVADPLTVTGSIGVFYTLFDLSGLLEDKIGITFDMLSTSPYADVFSGVSPLDAQDRALLERAADETYQTFLRKVAESRGLTVDQVQEIAQGRIWTGTHAKEVGLVDVVGGLDTAIRVAAEMADLGDGPFRTRTLPRPRTFIEQLNQSLAVRAADVWMRLSTTPAERALLDQAQTLRRLVDDHGTIQARMEFDVDVR